MIRYQDIILAIAGQPGKAAEDRRKAGERRLTNGQGFGIIFWIKWGIAGKRRPQVNNRFERLKGFAVLLLAAALLVTLLVVELQDRADKQKHSDILDRAAPLERERDELILRRDRLQRDYEDRIRAPGTEELLFLELDPRLVTELAPLLQERGLTGSLGLSETEFPGGEGKITRAEFDGLIAAGWDCCLVCRESDFAAWDRSMTEKLAAAGIEKPRTIYFPEDVFHISMEEEILRAGYAVIVHHGEDRLNSLDGELSGELWLIGAHPWNYAGVKAEIETLAKRSGAQCFTLRFSPGREEYGEESFRNMLDYLGPFLENGSLRVTGFLSARDAHDPEKNGTEAESERWEREREELNGQIRLLDDQILAIYREWNGEEHD